MKKLTQRQKEVLDTLKALIADKGYPPTVKELGKALGISDKATHDYLNVLKKKKKITWKSSEGKRSPRGIKILPDLFLAKQNLPESGIQQGDYVHCLDGELQAITRFFLQKRKP